MMLYGSIISHPRAIVSLLWSISEYVVIRIYEVGHRHDSSKRMNDAEAMAL
jgi:hypothetical protein